MDFRDIKFVYFKDTAPWRWGWVRWRRGYVVMTQPLCFCLVVRLWSGCAHGRYALVLLDVLVARVASTGGRTAAGL